MSSPAIITSPTCRFKTRRAGLHKPIWRGDVCGDCYLAMQASLSGLFTGSAPSFCHNCGFEPQQGDILSFVYRDVEAMILCEPCRIKLAPKLSSEIDATNLERRALIIKSANARDEIAAEKNLERKQTLWEQWRRLLGPRRKI